MKILIATFVLLFTFHDLFSQELPVPTVNNGASCGASTVVLTATSEIRDSDLIFEWYGEGEGERTLLGAIEGPQGKSEFITPLLIQDEIFFVRIKLGPDSSSFVAVSAVIHNEASILEAPRIELCGNVTLHANSTFVPSDVVSYQWQVLVPQEDGEAVFENIASPSSTTASLSLSELGFYRVVVARDDGCMAISIEMEVTDNRFIYAIPLGGGQKCFVLDNALTHEVILTTEYKSNAATYLWEESFDGVTFMPLSTRDTVMVIKAPAITSDSSVYYRLTVSEQNCSETSAVFSIDWVLSPSGTISHIDPAIGMSDFFFCNTDPAGARTLQATTSPGVSVTWMRAILIPDVNLDFIKRRLRGLNPYDEDNIQDYFNYLDIIGTGSTIILNQSTAGLIYAFFTDDMTGCTNYSSNAIFADTAFPFPLNNGVLAYSTSNFICEDDGSSTFNSYDTSVDSYSWQFLSSGSYLEIETGPQLSLNTRGGSVEGIYRLQVVKNGCIGMSPPFSVVESDYVEAVIRGMKDMDVSMTGFRVCPGEEVTLRSVNTGMGYGYTWIRDGGARREIIGTEASQIVTSGGSYFLEISNGACVDISDRFVVQMEPVPSVALNVDLSDPNLLICEPILLEITSPESSTMYQWYFSDNNLDYDLIAGETDIDYFILRPGYYFVKALNNLDCSINSDTLHVPVIVNADVNFSGRARICGSSDHSLLIAESRIASNNYTWLYSVDNSVPYIDSPGENDLFYYKALAEGYYKLRVSNEACSVESDPILVTMGGDDDFIAVVEGASSACLGSSVVLTSRIDPEGADYFWFLSMDNIDYALIPGETSSEFSFNTDRFIISADEELLYFKVGLKEGECSSLSDPFELRIIRRPTLEIRNSLSNDSDDVFYCDESELGFSLEVFQITTNLLDISYEWNGYNPARDSFEAISEATEKTYTPQIPGRYRCTTYTSGNECTSFSNEIDVITPPSLISGANTFCLSSTIELQVEQGVLPNSVLELFDIQWFYSPDGSTFSLIESEINLMISIHNESPIYGSGHYYYEASYRGCKKRSDVFGITEDRNSFVINIDGNSTQFKGIPFDLTANTTDDNILSYSWEPEAFFIDPNLSRVVATIPEAFEDRQVDLSVMAISAGGCTTTATIRISLSTVSNVVFSKLVTPNGDGLNDIFSITGLKPVISNTLRIIDNWGNPVYEVNNYNNANPKAQDLVDQVKKGVYYFIYTADGIRQKGSFYVEK